MTKDRIDEILGTEQELIPSSGFLASVMERVRQEDSTPPPIPFPWKRAVPGMALLAGVLGWAGTECVRYAGVVLAAAKEMHTPISPAFVQPLEQGAWTVAVVMVSLVSWAASRRAAR
jgi:hypothetical protein